MTKSRYKFIQTKREKHVYKYKIKNGETRYMYKGYVGIDEASGTKKWTTRMGFKTLGDAVQAWHKAQTEGTAGVALVSSKTFDEIWPEYFEYYKKGVKSSTAYNTQKMYHYAISPTLGKDKIDKITQTRAQAFANQTAHNYVGYRKIIRLASSILDFSIRQGLARQNAFKKIIMPKSTDRPVRDTSKNFYEKCELQQFLDAANKYSLIAYTFFALLANTGLRCGEALALTWKDIDFDKHQLHVSKTLAHTLNSYEPQPPKTDSSNRLIPMTAKLEKILKEWKKFCRDDEKIFYNKNGKWLEESTPNYWLQRIYVENPQIKKHITIHGFRHTFTTLLITEAATNPKAKITIADVQKVLGHSSIETTLSFYTHVLKDSQDRLRDSIDDLGI